MYTIQNSVKPRSANTIYCVLYISVSFFRSLLYFLLFFFKILFPAVTREECAYISYYIINELNNIYRDENIIFYLYFSERSPLAIRYKLWSWHLASVQRISQKVFHLYAQCTHNIIYTIYMYNTRIFYITSRFDIFIYTLFFCAFYLRHFFADRHCSFFASY